MEITIPFNYSPRSYQTTLYNAIPNGYKRGVFVWHRRAGKDKTMINMIVREMLKRVGTYYYFFPTYEQGNKVLWKGMDREGFPLLDHIPKEIRTRTDNTRMQIELMNGSLFQVVGTDKYDSIRGTNPIGCVFSEYSFQNPIVWDIVRPILAENGGWAFFNFTPNGENHAYDLHMSAKDNSNWFTQLLTVNDTRRADGLPVISPELIEEERKSGMSEEMIQQEYFCNYEAGAVGSYYSRYVKEANDDNRVISDIYDPLLPVETFWDLGIDDSMAIVFAQFTGKEIRIIDAYENSGEGLPHYIDIVKAKPYSYSKHNAPHDIKVRELTSGRSRLSIAKDLGISFAPMPGKLSTLETQDGIEAVRYLFKYFWFEESKTVQLLRALKNYQKKYDEKKKIFASEPLHDWSSHFADAIRYMAVIYKDRTKPVGKYSKEQVTTDAIQEFVNNS